MTWAPARWRQARSRRTAYKIHCRAWIIVGLPRPERLHGKRQTRSRPTGNILHSRAWIIAGLPWPERLHGKRQARSRRTGNILHSRAWIIAGQCRPSMTWAPAWWRQARSRRTAYILHSRVWIIAGLPRPERLHGGDRQDQDGLWAVRAQADQATRCHIVSWGQALRPHSVLASLGKDSSSGFKLIH